MSDISHPPTFLMCMQIAFGSDVDCRLILGGLPAPYEASLHPLPPSDSNKSTSLSFQTSLHFNFI